MKKIYIRILSILSIVSIHQVIAQNLVASKLIIANGESFGANASNIAIYDIATKTYEVFDTMGTNSVQDVSIEDNMAFVSAQTKIFAYDLDNKTKIAEVDFPGTSPSMGSIFTDDNHVFVGNWYGQNDSFLYAFDKNTLALDFAVTEATLECSGGLSLNDTLYISQKTKGNTDACAPYGCYADTTGSIIVANANTGAYYRTIDLGVGGAGISQIYNEGNYLFAVCASANKILKIEIGTDMITEISLPAFTQSTDLIGTKLYLDLNGKAGYYDLADGSMAISSLDLTGSAFTYDPKTEKAFATTTDYVSTGNLIVSTTSTSDTISIGVSAQAIGLTFIANATPETFDDSYEYVYDENVNDYSLSVLDNDTDADGETLTITAVSTPNISGATAVVDGQNIKYTRVSGIASTDYFTYTACDAAGECSTSIVHITLKSLVGIHDLNSTSPITIYPNPANDFIFINAKDIEIKNVEISNALGQIVKTSKESKISLLGIEKGIYFVVVKTNKGTYISKFIIK